MSLIQVGFQVTAGICVGVLAAQIVKAALSKIKAFNQRQQNREKLQTFIEETHDESDLISMEAKN